MDAASYKINYTSGEIEGTGSVGDCELHQIGHRSGEGDWAFISDDKYFIGASILLDHCFNLSNDVRIGSATESLVGSNGY